MLCANRDLFFRRALLWLILDCADTKQQEVQLHEIQNLGSASRGVCGKVLKRGDKGFKCLDCEMDSTCIICQECFEKGDHRGHRIFL